MDKRTLRALEWDRVLDLLSLCATTEEGRERVRALEPAISFEEVRLRHKLVGECMEGQRLCGHLSLEGYSRCETSIPSGVAFPIEVFRAAKANLEILGQIMAWLASPECRKDELSKLFPPSPEVAEISAQMKRLLDARGEVSDSASPALQKIRRDRDHLRATLQRKMEGLVERLGEKVLQQANYTVRNGRLVLPVLSNRRSEVKGVIHDASSTGATVFIEPLDVVEENNRIATVDAEEREEIHRVLVEASRRITASSGALEEAFDSIETLDLLLACGRMGSRCGGVLPELDAEGNVVKLEGAKHPLLDARYAWLRKAAWGESEPKEAVPLDITLRAEGTRTMVISGPNAGGKSVALKTLGLLSLMNQAGIPIPVSEGTSMPVFKFIFASLGDSQSILDSLSTFSARMVHLKEALDQIEEPFLVLLDELGAGTDPAEGAALGEATLLKFHSKSGFTLCSTHHEPLKARALITEGMGNACMEYSEADFKPTFRLLPDRVGSSKALEIAQRSGLPHDLLESARNFIPGEDKRLRDVLESLEAEMAFHRAETARLKEKRAEIDTLSKELLSKQGDMEKLKAQWISQIPARFKEVEDRFLAGLKSEVNVQSVRKRARKESQRCMEQVAVEHNVRNFIPKAVAFPKVGDFVKVIPFSTEGDVVEVEEAAGRVTVSCGGKSIVVGSGDVEVQVGRPKRVVRGGGIVADLSDARAEINLIGRTVEEAEAELEPFLDRAAAAGLQGVRIIHGIGTGRLKTGVRSFLRKSPLVSSIEEAPPYGGGAGVTLAGLKG